MGDTSGFDDDGLRRRNAPYFEGPRPRTSDEEDEEEEVEFKMAERKEEKPWLSLNKCIVGALVLLFLGSLFLSGEFLSCQTNPASLLLLFYVLFPPAITFLHLLHRRPACVITLI